MMKIKLAGHCLTACFSWQSIQQLINALINGAWKAKKASVASVAWLQWGICSGGYSSAHLQRKQWQRVCNILISVKAPLAVKMLQKPILISCSGNHSSVWQLLPSREGVGQHRQITSASLVFRHQPHSSSWSAASKHTHQVYGLVALQAKCMA